MRSWLGAGVLGCALTVLAVPRAAEAAEALIEILPVGDVVGDGATAATVHVLAMDPLGAPLSGLKLRATASQGQAGEVMELGGGLYAVTVTPPRVDAPTRVTVEVKGRTADKGTIDLRRELLAVPAHAAAIEATVNPPTLVLGVDDGATISLKVPAFLGEDASADDLVVRVSSGELGPLVPLGGGRFTARFTTPKVNYPHLAMISVLDRRDPDGGGAHLAIPLQGKVSYPVTVSPGANVLLRVAGREYGPVTADASGRASVPIVVPPGVQTATLVEIAAGAPKESTLDLKVPETQRLQLFAVSPSVPADARARVPLRVAVYNPDGTPDTAARPNLTATAGQVSAARHEGGGVYRAEYVPPDGRATMAATITATVPGGTVQSDGAELSLIPAMPVQVSLSAEPESLPVGATGLRIFARVRAADGTGLPGRPLRLEAIGATVTEPVVDLAGGDYRADLRVAPDAAAWVRATALAPVSRNGVAHVVLLPARDLVPADGATSESLTVVTTDAYGYPVAGVPVELTVVRGGGRLPATVTTGDDGHARVDYVVGATPGLVELRAEALGHMGAVGLLQGVTSAPALPPSGTARDIAVADALRATQSSLLVPRAGGAPVAAPSAPAAIATLALQAQPTTASPGGTVDLVIRASSAAGTGVPGQVLDLFATAGARFDPLVDVGGGEYRTRLTVPADAQGVIKVSVVGPGGAPTKVLELPVQQGGAGPWTTGPTPVVDAAAEIGQTTGPAAEEPAPVVTEAREPADHPWLRLKLAFLASSYAYVQDPSDNAGNLLPSTLAWGADNGRAAAPLGGEARLRLVVPQAPYVGLDSTFRLSRYSVDSPIFQDPARDTLFSLRANLLVRAPIRVKASEVSIGARVGYRFDDFVTFSGCLDPGCVVAYSPLRISGLGVGLQLGAELGKAFVVVDGDLGLAYGTQPYAVNVDADVGYHVLDNLFIVAGFGWQRRDTSVYAAESGELRGGLRDQQFLGTLGLGFGL